MEQFVEIGKEIKRNAKQDSVNLIHPFIEVQKDKKLSVIGIYDNAEESVIDGSGNAIPFDGGNYYYGLTPNFGADEVCIALKNGAFNDSASFEKFIDDNSGFFTLPATMKKYARALFAKTLVKMSTMFGRYLNCKQKECFELFCKVAADTAVKNLDYDINEKEQSVRLLGQPSEDFIKILDKNFSVNSDGDLILKTNSSTQSLSDSLSGSGISLVQGKVYYSGVLPRVKRFESQNTDYSNSDVMSVAIVFGRTTFATMDAFDGSYIKNHRLLKNYLPLLEEIDEHEDSLISKYLVDLSGTNGDTVKRVNEFLAQSYSAHNLAVSGNIITSDGYVLFAKRGKKTIDFSEYYCSINGQSEIRDSKVKFYKQSVYEDMPTICTDYDARIDFMSELERETEAELNIFCPASHWLLRGVSFLAIAHTDDNQTAARRRFHFNILGECITEYNLKQIITSQKKATEKFENSRLIGVKIKQYKNTFSRILNAVKTALAWILKSKDLVTSIFALAIFAIGFGELQNSEFTIKSLSSIISIIFTTLSSVVLIKSIVFAAIKFFKRKSTHYSISIIGQCKDYYKSVHGFFARKKINFHPIADVMMYEYIKFTLNDG